ncbi:ABC transporter substrate-binding protein [Gorillibacterium sp. CAU 1737]|uniref:ABC transporter substrate-binding protein n=1 Tax=Gorillibacterium sp. CAU 1737 TaxID=3140362 RepID=UPI0032606E48
MKRLTFSLMLVLVLAVMAGCSSKSTTAESPSASPASTEQASTAPSATTAPTTEASAATHTIKYLDKEYVVPVKAERIVIAGALEAMEDSVLLDVHPVGMVSFSGKFPALYAPIADKAESIGEKTEPNFEKILSLKPDVILGTSKFDEAVIQKLEQIAVTIPYSHVSTNWDANLKLLGELSGKSDEATKLIDQFKADLDTGKTKVETSLKDKKVAIVRIRQGEICIYGPNLFFNPILYTDLGVAAPDVIAAAKTQETLSVEKLAEMNPDVLYIQFSEDENANSTDAVDKLKANPIFSSINAVKNNQLFVNVVDPLAQGGTAYSKVQFLKAFLANVQ